MMPFKIVKGFIFKYSTFFSHFDVNIFKNELQVKTCSKRGLFFSKDKLHWFCSFIIFFKGYGSDDIHFWYVKT